jgi:hypothetical protein
MSDVPTLRERAQTVSWGELCEARDFIVGLAKLTRAMLVPAEHQGAPEVLGLREFALASDLMHAVGALAAVPWLTMFPEGVAKMRSLVQSATDPYRAGSSWLEAMPIELRAQLPRIEPGFLEQLDPELRQQVQQASREWAVEHPNLALALDNPDT